MRRTAISLLAGAMLVGAGALSAQQTVTEPGSGVPFPLHLTTPAGDGVLMGMGLRTKTFLAVKVYAFGLYVDSAAAQQQLASFAGKDLKTLQKDASFYDALTKLTFPMTLRLVMTRNVDGETMAGAFEEQLGPRVERAAAEMNMPGGVEALTAFRGYFSVEQMTKEAELVFTCANGTLHSRVKGAERPAISSPALCWALFDVYLGVKPISGDGKKKVIANFPGLLGPGT
jgi:hypothetical protein